MIKLVGVGGCGYSMDKWDFSADAQAAIGLHGPVAQISLRDKSFSSWAVRPPLSEISSCADKFYLANQPGDATVFNGQLAFILVRDPATGKYWVYDPTANPAPGHLIDPAIFFGGQEDATLAAERIDNLSSDYSGDIIINLKIQNTSNPFFVGVGMSFQGFYKDKYPLLGAPTESDVILKLAIDYMANTPENAGHGSIFDQDSNVPFVVSYPAEDRRNKIQELLDSHLSYGSASPNLSTKEKQIFLDLVQKPHLILMEVP